MLVRCKGCNDTGGPDGGYCTQSRVPRVMQLRSCTCWFLAKDVKTHKVLTEDIPQSLVPRVTQLRSCMCSSLAKDVRAPSFRRILHTVTCATCYAATILHLLDPCTGCKDTGCPDGGPSKRLYVPRVLQLRSCMFWSLAKDVKTQDVLTGKIPQTVSCATCHAAAILHGLPPGCIAAPPSTLFPLWCPVSPSCSSSSCRWSIVLRFCRRR